MVYMGLRNTEHRYGSVSQLLHWLMALAIIGLFGLGLWMDDLDYYDAWYTKAPRIHESIGLIVLGFLFIRLAWRWINPKPDDSYLKPWERKGAWFAHWGMYLALAVTLITGYLISTGGGKPVAIFDWVSFPSLVQAKQLPDMAGEVHEFASWALIWLAGLHALAALKHHFLDRDDTLRRMLPGKADH